MTRPPAPWLKDLNISNFQMQCDILRKRAHDPQLDHDWNNFREMRNGLRDASKPQKDCLSLSKTKNITFKPSLKTFFRIQTNSRSTRPRSDVLTHVHMFEKPSNRYAMTAPHAATTLYKFNMPHHQCINQLENISSSSYQLISSRPKIKSPIGIKRLLSNLNLVNSIQSVLIMSG